MATPSIAEQKPTGNGERAKRCTRCGEEKELNAFYVRGDRRGLRSECKACTNACWESGPDGKEDRSYFRWVKRTYNIDREEYEAMAEAQRWGCAICRCNPQTAYAHLKKTAQRLCVDHCHATGRIRGLLCHTCNKALGVFERSPETLEAMRQYLDTAQERTVAP